MRAAKERAEGADRAKSSFLAAASHDLRQPMHALGLYMAALRAEPDAGARDDLIERMDASVGALDTLFDALLDISRIDAGAIEPQPVPFAIEPMLRRLCADFAAQAADQGLRLSLHIAACARELNARSDPLLVERILRNLLGNAIKYTQDGGVLLACRLRGAGTPQRHWRIEVWDTGPGIPAAEQEHVFEEFYQLGNPERNRAAGLGLGLSIVRRLARLLGHPLALHSLPGHGSRFGIDLPATEAPALEPVRIDASAAGSANGTVAGMGVAVIDDDPDVRDSMTELLTRWGCDVVAGATGEEVLTRAGERPERRLHAALVDYQLRDGRNGIEAIRTLRSVCGEALPALLLSGASSALRLAEVKASGHPWLSKPVPAARLRSWLAQTTRRVAP
jgi:CheY-like chemotaxis protein